MEAGERVRVVFDNGTAMWHPLHLHGHTFALGGNAAGARKDTAIVLPHRSLTVEFDADNPGLWMVHCHNVYHAEAGMMTVLGYRGDLRVFPVAGYFCRATRTSRQKDDYTGGTRH
ncbi:hypothetical protein SVIOM74S_05025 [Streptomyces violarus]